MHWLAQQQGLTEWCAIFFLGALLFVIFLFEKIKGGLRMNKKITSVTVKQFLIKFVYDVYYEFCCNCMGSALLATAL